MPVTVTPASEADRAVIARLMPLYIHDFSELMPGRAEVALGEDGTYPDYPLDPYWREPDHSPLLIRAEGKLAGFALINAKGHTGLHVDHNLAEFFVARGLRRNGVGTAAAHAIITVRPGQWEVAVGRRNTHALSFWRRAIATCRGARGLEEQDRDDGAWNGHVIRFRVEA
jgi:predicted acetyltransferase